MVTRGDQASRQDHATDNDGRNSDGASSAGTLTFAELLRENRRMPLKDDGSPRRFPREAQASVFIPRVSTRLAGSPFRRTLSFILILSTERRR